MISDARCVCGSWTPCLFARQLRCAKRMLRGLSCLSECQFYANVRKNNWKQTTLITSAVINKKLISRWDSERELFYDEIVHVLQNTIDSCINSATDRRSYVLERTFTKFSEITQYNGHYAVEGHSRSPILVPIERSYTTSY